MVSKKVKIGGAIIGGILLLSLFSGQKEESVLGGGSGLFPFLRESAGGDTSPVDNPVFNFTMEAMDTPKDIPDTSKSLSYIEGQNLTADELAYAESKKMCMSKEEASAGVRANVINDFNEKVFGSTKTISSGFDKGGAFDFPQKTTSIRTIELNPVEKSWWQWW